MRKEPAGHHWRLGGELDQAERSLRATLKRSPGDARARTFLGDVLFLEGHRAGARSEYLLAFLVDPAAAALEHLADPGVAALAEASGNLYGLPGDVLDWIPAVGTVEGAFTLPPPVIPALLDPLPAEARPACRSTAASSKSAPRRPARSASGRGAR